MRDDGNRQRILKIALFLVAFAFLGFAACVPRNTPSLVRPDIVTPAHCPGGAILKDGVCECPPGTVEERNQCLCKNGSMTVKGGWHCEPFKTNEK